MDPLVDPDRHNAELIEFCELIDDAGGERLLEIEQAGALRRPHQPARRREVEAAVGVSAELDGGAEGVADAGVAAMSSSIDLVPTLSLKKRYPSACCVRASAMSLPLQTMIASLGYEETVFRFGLMQGLGLLVLSLVIRAPRPGEAGTAVNKAVNQAKLERATRDRAQPDILGDVCDLRAGVRRRADGDRAACADRQRSRS
jgi:hypothetical protein